MRVNVCVEGAILEGRSRVRFVHFCFVLHGPVYSG